MKIYHIFYADTVAKIRFADGTIQEIRGPAAEIIDTSTVREIDPSSAKELFGTPPVKEIEDKSDPTLVAKTIEVTARDISKLELFLAVVSTGHNKLSLGTVKLMPMREEL